MVITEIKLMEDYKKEKFTQLVIKESDILTPLAKEFINKKSIEIISDITHKINISEKKEVTNKLGKYKGEKDEIYLEKPEYMTQLKGNILVNKNSKIIKYRSKLDSFIAQLILTEKLIVNKRDNKLQNDFKSIKIFMDMLVRAEVMNEGIEENIKLLDLPLDKVRIVSHNPKKYYNMEHLFNISSSNKLNTLYLNQLRTLIREVEVLAVDVFLCDKKVERKDILKCLNRLSSAIYIMMLKEESGKYGNR